MEPIPAYIGGTDNPDDPILIIAALPSGDVLYVESDGQLRVSQGDWIVTDWRYNTATKTWYDLHGAETEDPDPQPDEEVETA